MESNCLDREFYISVKNRDFENALSYLLRGANISSKINRNLMLEAIYEKDIDIINFLIYHKIDLNIRTDSGLYLINIAIYYTKNYSIIKILIEGGSSVNCKSLSGQTPLESLICTSFLYRDKEEYFKCLRLLLEKGAEIFFDDKNILEETILMNDYDSTKIILEYVDEDYVEKGIIQNLVSKSKTSEMKKILIDYIEETLAFCNKCPGELDLMYL